MIFKAKLASKASHDREDSRGGDSSTPLKKRGNPDSSTGTDNANGSAQKQTFHIPKKKRLPSS